jgi:hypothetical protein
MTPLTAGRSDAPRGKDFGDFQLAPAAPETRDKMRQILSATAEALLLANLA